MLLLYLAKLNARLRRTKCKKTAAFIKQAAVRVVKNSNKNCLQNAQVRNSVRNVHHQPWRTLTDDDATAEWLPQWWHDPASPTPFSVDVWGRRDQRCMSRSRSAVIFPACCNRPVQIRRILRPSWGGINSDVSFSSKSTVVQARCTTN